MLHHLKTKTVNPSIGSSTTGKYEEVAAIAAVMAFQLSLPGRGMCQPIAIGFTPPTACPMGISLGNVIEASYACVC